ncbi:unnamed protein product [Bursaphelenchus okinawaensis]|uniref:CHK kinase-like domain-containing protein n=1 Tax=Bursaphelenchus okinawaensis TaxID=465554 RepID=A0A811KUT3_9BILA|nr:unnamed protein product [Bursaphelenchus okinawaensis]CAG9112651.1 unnamed protein product [Bursaphelenchus okinawaensis]
MYSRVKMVQVMDSKVLVVQVSSELDLDEYLNSIVTKRWVLDTLHGNSARFDKLRHEHSINRISYREVSGDDKSLYDGCIKIYFDGVKSSFELYIKNDKSNHILHEIKFYNYIGDAYSRMKLPRIYGYYSKKKKSSSKIASIMPKDTEHTKNKMGCMLMAEFDGIRQDTKHGFDIQTSLKIMIDIARYHAFTLCMPNSKRILEKFKNDDKHDIVDEKDINSIISKMDNEYCKENKDLAHRLVKAARKNKVKYDIPKVVVHGHLSTENIYFCKRTNGNTEKDTVSFLNWSSCHLDLGMVDVIRYTLLNTSGNVQNMCLERFIKIHHDTFKAELKKNNINIDFSNYVIKDVLKHLYPSQLVYCITSLYNTYTEAVSKEMKTVLWDRIKGGLELFKKLDF